MVSEVGTAYDGVRWRRHVTAKGCATVTARGNVPHKDANQAFGQAVQGRDRVVVVVADAIASLASLTSSS